MCELETWMGQKIPLTIDHIDGDNRNNELSNLIILCPNCHALTPTWCGKNKKRATQNRSAKYFCDCGKQIEKSNTSCSICRNQERHEYPPTDELVAGVEEFGYLRYAKEIGLSDNGLRKLLRRRGVEVLPKKRLAK